MNRRELLLGAAALPVLALPGAAQEPANRSRMGVVLYSYGLRRSLDPNSRFGDPAVFLEHCRAAGAGGVQTSLGVRDEAAAATLRGVAEKAGMYLEGIVRLPRDRADVDRFSAELRSARHCGATVLRTTLLDGRRYEVFDSADAFRKHLERGRASLLLARPIVEREKLLLAVENHKDLRSDELVGMLRELKSASLGVCVDTGNSIALLESPQETIEALAPLALTVHLKDMGVEEYGDGFRLSEVPLGTGFLDLARLAGVLRKARPQIRFNLEMITRDPLRIPCLTPRYWATLEGVSGRHLAQMLRMVRSNAAKNSLPEISRLSRDEKIQREEDNVRRCFAHTGRRLF
jgi:sugar phosphate isomerase/epimerase